MKKLKKIKLDIEKDVISSLSIDEQLQIKGGDYDPSGRPDWWTDAGICTRQCSMNAVTCMCGGQGGGGGNGNTAASVNCNTGGQTNNCAPTGSAISEAHEYNCYTIMTMCDC